MQKYLILVFLALATACGQQAGPATPTPSDMEFDWQGHRGARGLRPENTVVGFLHALDYPAVRTLELDLAVSADGELVVSHEPWFSADICSHHDGQPVTAAEQEHLLLYQMTYDQIAAFDCGRRVHPRFPEQQAQAAAKPRWHEVVAAADAYARAQGRPLPYYNVEIKSKPEWDGLRTPPVAEFAERVVTEIKRLGLGQRTTVQSFDPRALQAVRQLDPSLSLAYLVELTADLPGQLEALGFTPAIYSPYHQLVSANLVREAHARGMQVIPWTVNDTATMRGLRSLGVDGLITDYPNLIEATGK